MAWETDQLQGSSKRRASPQRAVHSVSGQDRHKAASSTPHAQGIDLVLGQAPTTLTGKWICDNIKRWKEVKQHVNIHKHDKVNYIVRPSHLKNSLALFSKHSRSRDARILRVALFKTVPNWKWCQYLQPKNEQINYGIFIQWNTKLTQPWKLTTTSFKNMDKPHRHNTEWEKKVTKNILYNSFHIKQNPAKLYII